MSDPLSAHYKQVVEGVQQLFADKRQAALDKKAENARELGLDYEPAQQDLPDLIAGMLGVSRGTAYDMMREALAAVPAQHKQGILAEQPAPLRDAIVVNLVREGVNKHRARELADHFVGLATAPAQEMTAIEIAFNQQAEKAK